MKLKNILIVVKDIEKSKQFYHDLFGLDQILDNDGNKPLCQDHITIIIKHQIKPKYIMIKLF